MRNAATFDDDLGYDAAPRKGAPRKPRAASPTGKKKKGARRPRFDMHRVARYAAIVMAATMALGIMVNALVLQKGHHPAPLFGKAQTTPAASQVAATPVPPVRAAQVVAPVEVAPVAPAKARKTVVASRDADTSAGEDAIGRLLAGGSAPARAGGKSDGKGEGKMVTGVQRALSKLGFKVPATGSAGPATKKAIEAFERDRHMPVKGEVDRHLVKVLAAESGIKID